MFTRVDVRISNKNQQKNAAAFARLKKNIRDSADQAYRRLVFAMFRDVVNVFPQFSGDTVANWRITVNTTSAPYNQTAFKTATVLGKNRTVRQAGDPEAANFAFTRAKFVQFGINDKVYFVNATPLEFGAKTVTGADGTLDLREENWIDGGQRIGSYLTMKYGGR